MATDTQSSLDLILVPNTRNGKYGGYQQGLLDEELTNLEKKSVLCTACNGILRDPMSVENKLKCRQCLEPDETGQPSASTCTSIADSLQVSCPLKGKGCNWKASISNLVDHTKSCQYFLQRYPNCPEMDVECSFKRYGCTVVTKRKNMEHHEKENITKHLKMMDKHLITTDDNLRNLQTELQAVKSQNQALSSKLQLVEKDMKLTFGGITCEIPGLREKLKRDQTCRSKEFYVGLYNFQAIIYPRKNNEEKLGIFIQIVRGQFDDKLVWPFSGRISFTLMSQINETNSVTNSFDTKNEAAFQKFTRSDNIHGYHNFATHQILLKEEFSKGDAIRIKILVQFDLPTSNMNLLRSYY